MPITQDVQLLLDKRYSRTKCLLMNEVNDPVCKRTLAFDTAPLGAITLTWHVISRAIKGVIVSDACVLTLVLVSFLGFNSPSYSWSNVWCGLLHYLHIEATRHFLAMCPFWKQFKHNPCFLKKVNLSS